MTLGGIPINVPSMDPLPQLLQEIEAFLQARKMPATTFGILAVNDGKLVSRLRAGANITRNTVLRVTEFLKTQQGEASV